MLYDREIVSRQAARRILTAARGAGVKLPRMGYEILLQVCAVEAADCWGCDLHLYLRNESGSYGIVPMYTFPSDQLSPTRRKHPLAGFTADELAAEKLRVGYAVRPAGAVGTCGFHPRAWSAVYVSARSETEAIRKAIRHG
jgi:hypothetical protein